MEISKIDIQVKVEQLKSIKVITNEGDVDANAEFDMLGVNPLPGASLLIGNHELFCKRIHQLSLGWNYTNLPSDFKLPF